MIEFIKWLVKVIIEFFERRRKMDYFITLNDKSIDAIGEAVEKPITVIDELKEDIAELEETVAEKDEEIEGLEEELANTFRKINLKINIQNSTGESVDFIVIKGTEGANQFALDYYMAALSNYGNLTLDMCVFAKGTETARIELITRYETRLRVGELPQGMTIVKGDPTTFMGASIIKWVITVDSTYVENTIGHIVTV